MKDNDTSQIKTIHPRLTQMDGINLNLTMLSENLNKGTLKKVHCQYY